MNKSTQTPDELAVACLDERAVTIPTFHSFENHLGFAKIYARLAAMVGSAQRQRQSSWGNDGRGAYLI
jgi:hypothetical protein